MILDREKKKTFSETNFQSCNILPVLACSNIEAPDIIQPLLSSALQLFRFPDIGMEKVEKKGVLHYILKGFPR